MRKLLIISLVLLFAACNSSYIDYPVSKKTDSTDVYFGNAVSDPYRWLEYSSLPETDEWIRAQKKITFDYLSRIPFRDSLRTRFMEIWDYERYSAPVKKGEKYFFLKNNGLQNQDVLYVMDSLGSEPRVILDPNLFSQDGTVALIRYAISNDGKYLAYALSKEGSDWNEIFVKSLISGNDLADHLEWVKFSSVSWYRNGFYYSCYPKPGDQQELTSPDRYHKVYYHHIGRPQKSDIPVFSDDENPDRRFTADVTSDERFLIIYESETSYGHIIHVKNMQNPGRGFIRLNDSFDNELVVVGNIENELYLMTDENASKNKLIKLNFDIRSGGFQSKTLIAEQNDVMSQVVLAGDKIFVKHLVDAHSVIRVMDREGKFLYEIKLPEYVDVFSMHGKNGDNELLYTLMGYTMPETIYRYDIENNKSDILFKPVVDFNPEDYITRLEFCTSKDGTRIPLYIILRRDIKQNGRNPVWLHGYGGFNKSLLPRFSPSRIVWLENGGIFVNANLRGGGEYGEEWHKAGIRLNKQNVFDDFIAAAEYLIREKYTRSSRLVIEGSSNGGLLVGVVVNQMPGLFGVAIPQVGVMDMLRYQRFTSGGAWESDYGSVNDSAEFNCLFDYSPLHNIREGVKYPAIMVTTGEQDDRVVPAHSFKYTATLQDKVPGPGPVLIRIQSKAGHGTGKPIRFKIEEQVDISAFALYNMHINPYDN
ncbi:MAG: S9 family peptidase [Bacteroidales bacterium]|nr:S9 family peptidase [Bacteroidales bacterium]MBN2764618.1 S9 family peptidase [Bacteroidales bacterium]